MTEEIQIQCAEWSATLLPKPFTVADLREAFTIDPGESGIEIEPFNEATPLKIEVREDGYLLTRA